MASRAVSILVLCAALLEFAEGQDYGKAMAKFAHTGLVNRGVVVANRGPAITRVNQPMVELSTLAKLEDDNHGMNVADGYAVAPVNEPMAMLGTLAKLENDSQEMKVAYQGLRARIDALPQAPDKGSHSGFCFGVFAGLIASVGLATSVRVAARQYFRRGQQYTESKTNSQISLAAHRAAPIVASVERGGSPTQRTHVSMMEDFEKAADTTEKSLKGKETFEEQKNTQMRSFNELKIKGDPFLGDPPPNCVDVYVHARMGPLIETETETEAETKEGEIFWFVGKSCAREGVVEDGPALSVVKQKWLVLEHAKMLQPVHLGSAKQDELELWCAPPNSEMSVAFKQQGLRSLDSLKPGDVLGMDDVGFEPEEYTVKEVPSGTTERYALQGFWVRLPPDGQPVA